MSRFTAAKSLGIFALIVALFVAPAAPAGAEERGSAQPQATAVTIPGTEADGDPSTLSVCEVIVYGYRGSRICEFTWSYLDHPSGKREYFVVGANYHIYHIWDGSGGWHSLGGRARAATPNGAYSYHYGVETYGTNNALYCRNWPWTARWFQC